MSTEDPTVYLRPANTRDSVQDQTRIFDSKKWLWVPDEEKCFQAACVKGQKGDKVTLELDDGSVSLARLPRGSMRAYECACMLLNF